MNIGEGKGRKNKVKTEREAKHKRLLKIENEQRGDGRRWAADGLDG